MPTNQHPTGTGPESSAAPAAGAGAARRWTTQDVHQGLTGRAALVARIQPPASQGRGQRPAVVRRLRITRPADGVVEAAAVVTDTHRVRALALRLEGWDTRWRLTALEVG